MDPVASVLCVMSRLEMLRFLHAEFHVWKETPTTYDWTVQVDISRDFALAEITAMIPRQLDFSTKLIALQVGDPTLGSDDGLTRRGRLEEDVI